jgi:hypothetical protein
LSSLVLLPKSTTAEKLVITTRANTVGANLHVIKALKVPEFDAMTTYFPAYKLKAMDAGKLAEYDTWITGTYNALTSSSSTANIQNVQFEIIIRGKLPIAESATVQSDYTAIAADTANFTSGTVGKAAAAFAVDLAAEVLTAKKLVKATETTKDEDFNLAVGMIHAYNVDTTNLTAKNVKYVYDTYLAPMRLAPGTYKASGTDANVSTITSATVTMLKNQIAEATQATAVKKIKENFGDLGYLYTL